MMGIRDIQSIMVNRPGSGLRAVLFATLAFSLFSIPLALWPKASQACSICDTETNAQQAQKYQDELTPKLDEMQKKFNENIDKRFTELEKWMLEELFFKQLLPNWRMMTEQISAIALEQFSIIGTMIDAKQQLETQRLFQQMAVRAHKDYQASEGVCTLATMTRSIAGTERNTDMTALVLSRRSLDRQLLSANSTAGDGSESSSNGSDRKSRFRLFRERYCDKNDNGSGLATVCQHNNAIPLDVLNKDIDYYRTVGRAMNLDLNFTDATVTDDERDVLALQANLYAPQVSDAYEASRLRNEAGQADYLDVRSIVAKRSVAENSFNTIAAMKAPGQTATAETAKYMRAALEELGISAADATTLIGDNPSYYAQMDVMTRKIFQRPEFFVDLYDNPANIERKSVALQAIALMQKRDIFKSALRTEAMLSLLLETSLIQAQEDAQKGADAR